MLEYEMHYPLMDITDRIAEPPKWWLDGIPRYCDFDPREATFAPTNLLVRVCCQQCFRPFDVALGTRAALKEGGVDRDCGHPIDSATNKVVEFGHNDPPFHLGKDGFNCVGNTMGAEWVAILQVWERSSGYKFKRRPDLEGPSPSSPI